MYSLADLIGAMFAAAVLTAFISIGVYSVVFHKAVEPMSTAVKKCEENLPRNQTCKITFQAVVNE